MSGHQREQGQAADGGVQREPQSPTVDPRELRQLEVVRLLLCEGQPPVAHFAATPTITSIAAGREVEAEAGHKVAAGAGVVRFPEACAIVGVAEGRSDGSSSSSSITCHAIYIYYKKFICFQTTE